MPAQVQRSEGDRYAALLTAERRRHGLVERELVGVITSLQKQVELLNQQLRDAREAYVEALVMQNKLKETN